MVTRLDNPRRAEYGRAILRGAEDGDVEYEEEEEVLQVNFTRVVGSKADSALQQFIGIFRRKEGFSWTPGEDDDDRSNTENPAQRSVFFDSRPISEVAVGFSTV